MGKKRPEDRSQMNEWMWLEGWARHVSELKNIRTNESNLVLIWKSWKQEERAYPGCPFNWTMVEEHAPSNLPTARTFRKISDSAGHKVRLIVPRHAAAGSSASTSPPHERPGHFAARELSQKPLLGSVSPLTSLATPSSTTVRFYFDAWRKRREGFAWKDTLCRPRASIPFFLAF